VPRLVHASRENGPTNRRDRVIVGYQALQKRCWPGPGPTKSPLRTYNVHPLNTHSLGPFSWRKDTVNRRRGKSRSIEDGFYRDETSRKKLQPQNRFGIFCVLMRS